MRSCHDFGASGAPSTNQIQVARVGATGVSPWMAVALADLFFPGAKRDDLAMLSAVTASRIAGSSNVRSLAHG